MRILITAVLTAVLAIGCGVAAAGPASLQGSPASAPASAPASGPASGPVVVDSFNYPSDASARAVWKPMAGTAEVSVVAGAGSGADAGSSRVLNLPCNFKGNKIERASWDHPIHLDMADATAFEFDVACDDPAPISSCVIYLHSGDGWYVGHFSAQPGNFKTVRIEKSATAIEEHPSSWAGIDMIRISAWRGGNTDTSLRLRSLRVVRGGGDIAIIRGESLAGADSEEWGSANQFSQSVAQRLDELGVPYAMMSDLDVTASRLAGTKLVILPHNPSMPAKVVDVLAKYLSGGGKAIVFYVLPNGLQKAVGIASGRHIAAPAGHFSSIQADKDNPLAAMPAVTKQASWNIQESKPVAGRSKAVAQWCDSAGKPTGQAAIVASDNCMHMTHVLLEDDPANKRRLLMAMAGALVPELWPAAAKGAIDRALLLGGHQAAEASCIASSSTNAAARTAMQYAMSLLAQARTKLSQDKPVEAIELAQDARDQATKAYCLLETPAKDEHRAFWCHNAFGVSGIEWDAAIKNLADNGFTAIQVNMAWGGTAYYDSSVLPVAAQIKQKGDQVAACLAACRKYGVQCHIWKVNWNMGGQAPADFIARMKKDGRIQADAAGKPIDQWLCPSNPANQKLEIDAMVELATKYDVDGIHFDYIRYPGPEGCFCGGCRQRFEKTIGQIVAHWPADVQSGPLRSQWLDFRRDNITAVVAAVSEAVRKDRPKVKISAAVFGNWPADRDSVGQDWKLWCDRGYLDYVCPMDYTPDSSEFANLLQRQMQWAGKVKCYPGIGLSCWGNAGDIFTLFDQIRISRAAHTGGFTIFNYDQASAGQAVPACGMGITSRPPHNPK